MPVFHSRSFRTHPALRIQYCPVHIHRADHFCKHLRCNSSRPQNHGRRYRHVKYRRLHSYIYRSAVNYHINLPVQIMNHMFRCCRTWPSGCIGTGRRHKPARCPDQLQRDRIRGHSDRHCFQTAGSSIGHYITLPEYHCKRARPEMRCQSVRLRRNIYSNAPQILVICNMNNQRIIRRAPFRLICFFCRLFLQCICSQSIYCFRRKSNQSALFQDISGLLHNLFIDIVFIYFFY